jgi:hypothetical protein
MSLKSGEPALIVEQVRAVLEAESAGGVRARGRRV